jgi:hypothetical protein
MYVPISTHHSVESFGFKLNIGVDEYIDFLIKNRLRKAGFAVNGSAVFADTFVRRCIENSIEPLLGVTTFFDEIRVTLFARNWETFSKIFTDRSAESITAAADFLYCVILDGFDTKHINRVQAVFGDDVYIPIAPDVNEIENNRRLSLAELNDCKYVIAGPDNIETIPTETELRKSLSYLPSGVIERGFNNANEITAEYILPETPYPKHDRSLEDTVFELFDPASFKNPATYVSRIKEELRLIKKFNIEDYFLTVYEYVSIAKRNFLRLGPGRGSATCSLVAFILGITEVDPIKYNLSLDRFLSDDRDSLPDIDIDLAPEDRDTLINILYDRYGVYHHVVTVKADFKTAANVAAEILDIGTRGVYIDEEKIKQYPRWKELTDKYIGKIIRVSTHPSAFCITDKDIPLPIFVRRCAYSKLNKFDILSVEHLKKLRGSDYTFDSLETWNTINKPKKSMFQLSKKRACEIVTLLNPRSIESLADVMALTRLSTDLQDRFIENKKRRVHPIYDSVTKKTRGVVLYQDQILELCRRFGIENPRQYIKRPQDIPVPEIKDELKSLSGYMLCRGHAIAYAMTLYRTV